MAEISREQLNDELRWYSEAVSKGVRTMAVSVIAGIWTILTAELLILKQSAWFGLPASYLVAASFLLSSLTLLIDLVQYVAAYPMTDIGIDRWQATEAEGKSVSFDYTVENLGRFGMLLYRTNYYALRAKLFVAIAAGLAFVLLTSTITLASSNS
ncbi:MAG: hypothetical protein AAFZ38_00920 [Myxococcota bacterium]